MINTSNLEIQTRKGLIPYYKKIIITTLKKKCGCKPCYCCKNVWRGSEQFNKKEYGKTTNKKRPNVFRGSISNFFVVSYSFKKDDV